MKVENLEQVQTADIPDELNERRLSTELGQKSSVKKDLLKRAHKEWANITCIDSYAKIFQYEHVHARIFWSVLLFILTVLTALLVLQIAFDYFQFDVVTQINTIVQRPMTFPTITVCYPNPFTTAFAQSLLLNISKEQYGVNIDDSSVNYEQTLAYLPNITELTKMYVAQHKSLSHEHRLGLGNMSMLYLSVTFDGVLADVTLDWYYSYDYGNCVQFNANDSTQLYSEGKEHGLSIIYPLLTPDTGILYSSSTSDGMVVFIHESSFEPISTDMLAVSFYDETHVAISKTVTIKYPWVKWTQQL